MTPVEDSYSSRSESGTRIASKHFLISIHGNTSLAIIALPNLHICMLISFFNILIEYNVYINKDNTSTLMYILEYINLYFQKLFWEVNIVHAVFVKYSLINIRSPNQYTISIDLLSFRISIRIISIRISKQSKHRDQQAKG